MVLERKCGSLKITTIGSFPPCGGDIQNAIQEVIALQRRCDIDILSDGEQRMDMIGYFSSAIPGLDFKNGLSSIKGKIKSMPNIGDFSKVKDLKFIKSLVPESEIKISITGPVTLGFMCSFGGVSAPYSDMRDKKLYVDLVEPLRQLVTELSRLGAYVQIDEPGLSQGFMEPVEAVRLIDSVATHCVYDKTSVHVCGNLRTYDLIGHLLKLKNIGILSHAFAGETERGNIELVSRKSFSECGKRLGLGCIAVTPTKTDAVDKPNEVADLIRRIRKKLGEDRIAYLHPDCGLRASPTNVVEKILQNLKLGMEESKREPRTNTPRANDGEAQL
ncbi:MAG TPA: hypothetical protein VJ574_00955 [Candidatus Bathyarchaeia archaeon]|nr:hypothetical protein [Candidatus Bathyarchaeia archaeon]